MTALAEHWLWIRVRAGEPPRSAIARGVEQGTIPSTKSALATLQKWSDRGLYDWGVAIDLGWLTPGAVFPRAHEVNP